MLTLSFARGPEFNIPSRYPTVIFSGPIEAAHKRLQEEISIVRSVAPESQALPGLERHAKLLGQAIEEARRIDGILCVEDVARIEGVTEQAVRKRLDKGQYPGAEKRGGVWRIPKEALNKKAA